MLPRGLDRADLDRAEEEDESLLKQESIRRSHEDRDKGRRKLTKKPERMSIKDEAQNSTLGLTAAWIVGAEPPNFIGQLEDGSEIRCHVYKGTDTGNPNSTFVAIGDRVLLSLEANEDVFPIQKVLARQTKLSRKAAGRADDFEQVIVSNVDTLVIVASVSEPPLRTGIIDRYIVAALEGSIEPVIAINKIDLANDEEKDEIEYYKEVYEEVGYPVFTISSVDRRGIEELKAALTGKLSVFAGHSGVGKSSIINALFGREVGKTGVLSKKYQRGAHTTSSSTLRPLEGVADSFVIDTPGVREFANHELDPQNLKFYFAEFLPFQEHCQITNCSHIHEPGCAVRQALEEDKISIERYTSYEKLLEEAEVQTRKRIDRK